MLGESFHQSEIVLSGRVCWLDRGVSTHTRIRILGVDSWGGITLFIRVSVAPTTLSKLLGKNLYDPKVKRRIINVLIATPFTRYRKFVFAKHEIYRKNRTTVLQGFCRIQFAMKITPKGWKQMFSEEFPPEYFIRWRKKNFLHRKLSYDLQNDWKSFLVCCPCTSNRWKLLNTLRSIITALMEKRQSVHQFCLRYKIYGRQSQGKVPKNLDSLRKSVWKNVQLGTCKVKNWGWK